MAFLPFQKQVHDRITFGMREETTTLLSRVLLYQYNSLKKMMIRKVGSENRIFTYWLF
jgi:hypothetical protein